MGKGVGNTKLLMVEYKAFSVGGSNFFVIFPGVFLTGVTQLSLVRKYKVRCLEIPHPILIKRI